MGKPVCHKIILLTFFAGFITASSFSQSDRADSVFLVSYHEMDCDDTYDPYKLNTRITSIEVDQNNTIITVNFAANCSQHFNPDVTFENGRLSLISDTFPDKIMADCYCCFSLVYTISGLIGKEYSVYFDGKKVELSSDYYKTVPASAEIYEGKEINRTNKYGFREGRWMKFYEDGRIQSIYNFPETVLYEDESAIWGKSYYPNGDLAKFMRNDTTQIWFKDGSLKYENYSYTHGDTTFEYRYERDDFKILQERSLTKKYTIKDHSKKVSTTRTEFVIRERSYENGQRAFLMENDTTRQWYRNGQIRLLKLENGWTTYDSLGNTLETCDTYHWLEDSLNFDTDFKSRFHVIHSEKNVIRELNLSRYEQREKDLILCNYLWKFTLNGELISSPENWHEAFPWDIHKEIKLPRSIRKKISKRG